jgi:ATP-binding cassette subfamily F protein uup
MNLVTLEAVGKQYGERVLLHNANLLINEGDRIGLIGRNGSGKTSLLKMIAGLERPDSGRLQTWGKVIIRYLPQEPQLNDQLTVLDTLFQSDSPQMQLLRTYEQVTHALHTRPDDPHLQTQLAQLNDQMEQHNGWAAEANAKMILTQLGVAQFDSLVGTLSGGQRKRVALAQALLDPGHLLILDEPTNHIDADTIQWLQDYLLNLPSALFMVTHDRYFLEQVVNKIVELDRRELVTYPGNYTQYLEQRTTRHEQLAAQEEKRQNLLRRELEWLRRGAQARSTKQKARKERVMELMTLDYDRAENRVAMALAGRRLGKRVLEAKNISKSYGSLNLFKNIDFHLDYGDRIGIVGPNGAGKTSFLDILAGKTRPDSGEINWGPTVELAYFDQRSEGLMGQDDSRLDDYINNIAPLLLTPEGERIEAPQMLEWFLFPRPEQATRLVSLSGGERRRLYLLGVLAHQPNVLFLDEPTNDLDVQTLTVLEQFLDAFEGCLVVVSHDRYFLDRNVDFIMSFEDGVLGTRYPTPYVPRKPAAKPKPAAEKTRPEEKAKPTKLSWKEQKQLTHLEEQIATLESKIAELEQGIHQNSHNYQQLTTLTAELETANATLEQVMGEWLELSERAGG